MNQGLLLLSSSGQSVHFRGKGRSQATAYNREEFASYQRVPCRRAYTRNLWNWHAQGTTRTFSPL